MTCATLASPVGDVRLAKLNAEIRVTPLVNVAALVIGAPVNWAVVPPAMEAIDTTLFSYVMLKVYAPSGLVPTSMVTSLTKVPPPCGAEVGQLMLAIAAAASFGANKRSSAVPITSTSVRLS